MVTVSHEGDGMGWDGKFDGMGGFWLGVVGRWHM